MNTSREGILQALVALVDPLPGMTVFRSREAAFARSEGVCALIRPEEESVVNQVTRLTVRDLAVEITVIARDQIPDQVADPFVRAIHAAIAADQTLGGRVARIIEESTKWDFEVADQNAVAVVMRYVCRYMTPVADLSVLA